MLNIKRRSILQALLALPALPLAKRPARHDAGTTYTDSQGRTTAQLAALYDGKTKTGGVDYSA
jgi:hypothetical protein